MFTTASIIGREFDFRLLGSLIDNLGEDQLLDAIDEAVSAQLIEEVSNRAERFQFSHALIQRTLAEEMTTTGRVRLHARTSCTATLWTAIPGFPFSELFRPRTGEYR